jgi:hypothetical protein
VPRRLAQFAWIAAVLDGQTWSTFEPWITQRLGVELPRRVVDRHVRPVRPRGRQGRAVTTGSPSPREAPAFWRTVHVDEPALGLGRHLLRVMPASVRESRGLERTLPTIPGVRQVLRLAASGEYLIVAIVRTGAELDELRARIQEHASGVVGSTQVDFESHAGASRTWLNIARRELDDPLPVERGSH